MTKQSLRCNNLNQEKLYTHKIQNCKGESQHKIKINRLQKYFERIPKNSEEKDKKMEEKHEGQEYKTLSKYKCCYLRYKITEAISKT